MIKTNLVLKSTGKLLPIGSVIFKGIDGKWYMFEKDIIPVNRNDIIHICKLKHFRFGPSNASSYGRLQTTLKEIGLTDEETERCLHP